MFYTQKLTEINSFLTSNIKENDNIYSLYSRSPLDKFKPHNRESAVSNPYKFPYNVNSGVSP